MGSRLHIPILLIAIACFSTLYSVLGQKCRKSIFYEPCTRNEDCYEYNGSDTGDLCAGRDSNDEVQVCPHDDVLGCACSPVSDPTKFCTTHSDCPDQSYCGASPRTGSQICVGCLSLNGKGINFTAVSDIPSDRCTNINVHPPCGAISDYCSPSMPCASGYQCVANIGGTFLECSRVDRACKCAFPVTSTDTTLSVRRCETDDDCENPRESCMFDTRQGMNSCISCDAIDNSFNNFLVLNDSTKCDGLKGKRKPPRHYFPSTNGKTNDLCVLTSQCDGKRKCFQYKDDTLTSVVFCKGANNLCFCRERDLTSCISGEDCDVGESCAFSMRFVLFDQCVSNAFLATQSVSDYDITGNRTATPVGDARHLDSCRYDWDCRASLRCTHSTTEFGGCAGRAGCQCKPLVHDSCSSDSDCTTAGEACATFIDGKVRPFCVSAAFLNATTNGLIAVNATVPRPKRPTDTYGLTEDVCIVNGDCRGNRTCMYNNEMYGSCNRRNFCSCVPDLPVACNITSDCTSQGEVCVGLTGTQGGRQCISSLAFDADTSLTRREFGTRSTPPPTRTPTPSASPSSMSPSASPSSMSPSASPSSMSPSALPSEPVSNTVAPDESMLPEDPSTDPVEVDGAAPTSQVSPDITVAENENEVCIDTKLLEHILPKDLVYKSARRAAVLCDTSATCATPSHMVQFRGMAMSMRRYCELHAGAKCEKRVRWVNSPRMRYGLRIASWTADLTLTAHAARYETALEQFILSRIINVLGF